MDFYNGQIEKVNGLKGFVMINNFEDNQSCKYIILGKIVNVDKY